MHKQLTGLKYLFALTILMSTSQTSYIFQAQKWFLNSAVVHLSSNKFMLQS